MKDKIRVKCNNCDWVGFDDELELIGIAEIEGKETPIVHESRVTGHITVLNNRKVDGFIDGCPNCLTDEYLMNVELKNYNYEK